ncbi:hypothetical protein NPX93_05620 [Bacillus mycoides]|uniref:hypothetical protein n=1 Tax=Bacillus mycoides TaxID=1405 RepID=UPI0021126B03|nr:hypothetical protein [Bacillus mycoides]MCQ6532442.1 hypothetical protein [Bacillus mycoides]
MEQIALVCSIFFVLLGFEAVAKDVEEFWWESKGIAGYMRHDDCTIKKTEY